MDRIILHCDMNNFYASVECVLNPNIKGKPVAVCGSVEERRGIVLAANYIAKKYGIGVGDVVWKAKKDCKDLVVVSPHHEKYEYFSIKARKIYERYTDIIEPFGIDECWLDVTGSTKLFGTGEEIANKIREDIKKELKLTISVGVSFNKAFAKLGSDMKKPDATTVITRDNYKKLVWPLPVKDLLGVGRKNILSLNENHILTIGDLANEKKEFLEYMLGQFGATLYEYANGNDDSEVLDGKTEEPIQSVGHGITTKTDLVDNNQVKDLIIQLSREIGDKLRLYKLKAEGLSIAVKNNEFKLYQYQIKMLFPTQSHHIIAREALKLFIDKYDWEKPIRMITVTGIDLIDEENPIKLSFYSDYNRIKKFEKADYAVNYLTDIYGDDVIK